MDLKLNDSYKMRNLKTGLNTFSSISWNLVWTVSCFRRGALVSNRMEDKQNGPPFDIKLYVLDKVHVDKNVDNAHCSLRSAHNWRIVFVWKTTLAYCPCHKRFLIWIRVTLNFFLLLFLLLLASFLLYSVWVRDKEMDVYSVLCMFMCIS